MCDGPIGKGRRYGLALETVESGVLVLLAFRLPKAFVKFCCFHIVTMTGFNVALANVAPCSTCETEWHLVQCFFQPTFFPHAPRPTNVNIRPVVKGDVLWRKICLNMTRQERVRTGWPAVDYEMVDWETVLVRESFELINAG